ncbi:MAG: Rho GTPase activation protein, partial [Benniella sp.]
MESVLQAATKVEFEEWKAALFYWHPPDDEIPQIDTLKISTPPVPMLPRPRHLSIGRMSDQAICSPKPRMSTEFPVVIKGDLFVLDLRAKPMNSQNKVGTWKRINCCIRSNGHFAQYNVGETEKPFETIPLADTLRTHIWALDGSLFSKKHCFSIKAPHDVNYYSVSLKRSSTDQETFNAWLFALKSYAKPEIFGASELLEYRLYRTFWIMVNDGRRLPKDLEAYCEIMLDDQRRARTSTRTKQPRGSDPEAPFWRDGFEFTDLAAFTKGITINVIQTKGSKLIPFGRTHIPVRNSEECDEGWYPILHFNDRTKATEHLGDLRLKLKYEEQIVLPLVNYYDVLEILLNFQENNVISKLAGLVTDLEGFSRNVLRILEGRGMAVVWLNSLIDGEIAEADSTRVNTLFRGNTLLTKALDSYMRLVGTEYLDDTLGDILRNICKNKIACEVDPSKLEKGDDLKAQWKLLMFHTRACWRAVTESVNHFPKDLLLVFAHLQKRLTEKFSDRGPSGEVVPNSELASQARYTGISGFVFLRLICPAILGPKLFHIVREHPEARAHRTLTLIAKSLQGLANLVMFGIKESWMVPMNEFIDENTKSLKDFIDQICTVSHASAVSSRSNSVHSLSSQPPQSPVTTSPSVFSRSQSKNGSGSGSLNSASVNAPTGAGLGAGAGVGTGPGAGAGAGPSLPSSFMTAPSSSHGSQTQSQSHSRNSLRAQPKDIVQPPIGSIDPALMERNQDMPLLPHLIDLGKELAHFTTTVARVIPPWPQQQDAEKVHLVKEAVEESNGLSQHELRRRLMEGNLRDDINGRGDDGDDDHGDILRKVGRACWDVIETIQERVELSVEVEQEERRLAAQAMAAQVHAANGGIGEGIGLGVSGGIGMQGFPKGKPSREGSRDGEESYVVYEHYENHDLEAESFDGYTRGYDSDDEQRSAHDL